jgi:hypothetical protein
MPDFKTHCRAIATKTAWHWHKNRCIDKWNWIEIPEINPHTYSQQILDRSSKKHIVERKVSAEWCWENCISICRRMTLNLSKNQLKMDRRRPK